MDLLVVEDESHVHGFVSAFLERDRVSFKIAEYGAEAIEMARQEWPRAVLLDLGLPGRMDGWDVWDRLLAMADGRPVRIILFTAVLDSTGIEKAAARGGYEMLSKPIDPNLLRAVIKRVLGSEK